MSVIVKKKRGRKKKIIYSDDKVESETLIFHLPIDIDKKDQDIFIKKSNKSNKNIKLLNDEILKLKKENKLLNCKLCRIKPTSKKIIKYHLTNYNKNTKCWWCKHHFDTPAVGLPENYYNDTFELIGNFCSFNCAKSYNMDLGDNNIWKRNSLLDFLTETFQ